MNKYGKRSGNHKLWWAVHNIFAHPISYIFEMCGMHKAAKFVHDETIPIHLDD